MTRQVAGIAFGSSSVLLDTAARFGSSSDLLDMTSRRDRVSDCQALCLT
ncbi:MAG: hypothetical protein LBL36_01590 [Clostridiales Family XIII bacterium]|nr:hypothetical protein [Clostridiales Family XIII bacterium]